MEFFEELMSDKRLQQQQPVKVAAPQPVTQAPSADPSCEHPEVYSGICLRCNKILSAKELEDYRQFAFLNHSHVQVRQSHGKQMVQEKKQKLIEGKKLVLVLDLDNTLIHTKDVPVEQQRVVSSDPVYKALVHQSLCIYEVKVHRALYHVKLRPFLVPFLVGAIGQYDIYFYTAGTKFYGNLILEVFKMELQMQLKKEEEVKSDDQEYVKKLQLLHSSITSQSLISRDDEQRFQDKEEKIKKEEEMLRIYTDQGMGGDSTLNMKSFLKNIKALTGGDDSIFVVIDDRADVWTQSVKDESTGKTRKEVCGNLIQIFPYFYYENEMQNNPKVEGFRRLLWQVGRKYNLDLSLLCHLQTLQDIHSSFFKDQSKVESMHVKDLIREHGRGFFCGGEEKGVILAALFKQKNYSFEQMSRTYENCLMSNHGLQLLESIDVAKLNIYLLPDRLSQQMEQDVRDLKNGFTAKVVVKFISIYWLYLSYVFQRELPMDCFEEFNEGKASEIERIYNLLMRCLQEMDPGLHQRQLALEDTFKREIYVPSNRNQAMLGKRTQPDFKQGTLNDIQNEKAEADNEVKDQKESEEKID